MRAIYSRTLLILISVLLAAPFGRAQEKPKVNAQVNVAIRVAGVDVPTNGLLYFQLWEVGGPMVVNTNWWGAGVGATTQSPPVYALMTPNHFYQAIVSASPWQYGEVKFSAPAGYTVWINDQPASTYRLPSTYDPSRPFLVYKVMLRPTSDSSILPGGRALPPAVGDLVWGVSAGTYGNGISAGTIGWRTTGLSANLLNATSLEFVEPNTAEIRVTRHSDGGLLEVSTFQFLLYVRRNATAGTGYTVEIYHPYVTRTGTGDGPYSYSEAPYRQFIISNPDASWLNRIQIQMLEGAVNETRVISQSGSNWSVVQTTGSRTVRLVSTGASPRVETVTVEDGAGVVYAKTQRTYQGFSWGQEELVQEIANPDAINGQALTTSYAYNTTWGSGGYGRLDSVTNPDGSWSRYVYDDSFAGFGNLAAVYQPWQDGPASPGLATASNCKAMTFGYVGERNIFLDLPAGTQTVIQGATTAMNAVGYSFPGNAANGQPLRAETVNVYTNSSSYLTTSRLVYNPTNASPDFLGRLYSQTNPDGTKVSNLRYKAYWYNYGDSNSTNLHIWPGSSSNNTWGEYHFSGFSSAVQGAVPVNNWDGQYFDTVYMVPNRSTVDLDVYNAEGRIWEKVHYVFTGASGGTPTFEFLSMTDAGYTNGVLSSTHDQNGAIDNLSFIDGRLSGHTGNDGTYVEYTRDALGRDYLVRKWALAASGSYPAQGMIYTHKTFDMADRVLTEKVSSSSDPAANPADAVTTSRVFNLAGQLVSESTTNGAGTFTTTYAYANGGRTVTTTVPGGATKITDRYLDGTAKSLTGTGVVAAYYGASVNPDGTVARQTTAGAAGGPRWTKATTDWSGRMIKEERPAPPGATPTMFTRQYYYNTIGQLVKTSETNLADRLVVYNAWQQPFQTGLDLNANGSLDTVSTDRITETDTLYVKDANAAWWTQTTTKAYNVDNSATPVVTGVTKARLNKYDDHGLHWGSFTQSEAVSLDIFGNQTRKTVDVQRGSSYFATDLCLVTETVTYPDSSTPAVSVTRNGLLQTSQSKEGLLSWFYYDARGRLVKQTNPRTDTSTTPRIGYVANADLVAWRQDGAGNQTSYTYQSTTGLLAWSTDPLGKQVFHVYDTLNHEIQTWGAATYPVEYVFNAYGERTSMSTFRGGSGWDQPTWPVSPGTADTTTWAFDPATGVLTSKTDASAHTVGYTYNARGQLATRVWSRNVTTTYSYSATTAEQTGIAYTDGTPNLSYTYNRLGQNTTVTDYTGTRTFNYSPTTTLLMQEDLGAFVGTRSIARTYDTTTAGAQGRPIALGYGPTATPTSEYGINYGYDGYGRANKVWYFNYSYQANSNLISGITDDQTGYTQTRTYEANRDLLADFSTRWSGAVKADFAYTNDTLGRRTAVTKSGDLFSRYNAAGLTTSWGYDDRNEVTSEQTVLAGTATALSGRNDSYAFDNIGNRASTTHNGNTSSYAPNALNQYSQRTVPGHIDVAGLAPASATVTVNSSSAGIARQGDYYFQDYVAANSSSGVWQSLTVASSLGGSTTRSTWLPAATESFAYDADGNLLSDGRWDYTYDAENRLVSMQTHTALSPSPFPNSDARRLEFKYDYLGRRVEKIVRSGYNGTSYASLASDMKFVYDGWNVIVDFECVTGSIQGAHQYVWGLDLSGSLQGAGGVGGLMAQYNYSAGTWTTPAYDGNGNVMALINRATGGLNAAYEYDASGQTIAAYGTGAAGNLFRFSTKFTDSETGLVYYGHRYYSPSLGRFINKDPIEEQGGLNLYAFCSNNGVNHWDLLGNDDPWDNWLASRGEWVSNGNVYYRDANGNAQLDYGTTFNGIHHQISYEPVGGFGNFGVLVGYDAAYKQIDDWAAKAAENAPAQSAVNTPYEVNYNSRKRVTTGSQNGKVVSVASDSGLSATLDQFTGNWMWGFTPSSQSRTAGWSMTSSDPNNVAQTPQGRSGVDVTIGYTAAGGSLGTAYHSFDILTDRATGQTFATRAGPASRTDGSRAPNGFGPIHAVSGQWDANFPDAPNQTLTTQFVGTINIPFDRLVRATIAYQNLVNSADITYRALYRNSNSYAYTYLDWLRLQRPEPAVPAPGAGNTLDVPVPPKP